MSAIDKFIILNLCYTLQCVIICIIIIIITEIHYSSWSKFVLFKLLYLVHARYIYQNYREREF